MKLLRLAIALLTLVTLANAQDTLVGKWKITWLQGGKPNVMYLVTDNPEGVQGTYTNDSAEACPVEGTFHAPGLLSLVITCSKFNIDLLGEFSHAMGEPNDDEIVGKYFAYGATQGTFRMDRQTCMLPEGCK